MPDLLTIMRLLAKRDEQIIEEAVHTAMEAVAVVFDMSPSELARAIQNYPTPSPAPSRDETAPGKNWPAQDFVDNANVVQDQNMPDPTPTSEKEDTTPPPDPRDSRNADLELQYMFPALRGLSVPIERLRPHLGKLGTSTITYLRNRRILNISGLLLFSKNGLLGVDNLGPTRVNDLLDALVALQDQAAAKSSHK